MYGLRYDLKDCVLLSDETDEELARFDARIAANYKLTAGNVGSGIASSGQSFCIATQAAFNFEPGNHAVRIGGQRFLIASKRVDLYRQTGQTFTGPTVETILELD